MVKHLKIVREGENVTQCGIENRGRWIFFDFADTPTGVTCKSCKKISTKQAAKLHLQEQINTGNFKNLFQECLSQTLEAHIKKMPGVSLELLMVFSFIMTKAIFEDLAKHI